MSIGIPGRSNAFAIARRLGLNETILDDAMRLVGAGSHEADDMLDSIYALREKMESEEAGTRLALREAEETRERLTKRLQEVESEREKILMETREEAQEELESIRAELRQARRQIRDAASLNKLKNVGKEVEEIEQRQVEPIVPLKKVAQDEREKKKTRETKRTLEKGDTVLVKSLNAEGDILELGKKDALLAIGRMQMRAQYEDLEFKARAADEVPEMEVAGLAVSSPGMELDIRGRRVEDGLMELDRYLDAAYLAHLPWVRIIHGKGTGKLREATRKALGKNPNIQSWEEGKDGEGGAGVTVAKFKEQG
jgi:DNA mismatch repair protein MutS2